MPPYVITMKPKLFAALLISLATGAVSAQTTEIGSYGQALSDAGASAATGPITFEASEPRSSQRLHTTPSVYVAPSMFGGSNNCGASDSVAMGFTGFGIGGSRARESAACNAREDTSVIYRLGFADVAQLRFLCFGEPENRMAYEAAGYACPESGTAKGIEGAPVGPKYAIAASVQRTSYQRINTDGTITEY